MNWVASNRNYWGDGTISDGEFLPFFYVISRAGIIVERDDGEVRKFRMSRTALAFAERMNKQDAAENKVLPQ